MAEFSSSRILDELEDEEAEAAIAPVEPRAADVGGSRHPVRMTTSRLKIDEILRAYFEKQLDGVNGVKRRRIERVEHLLRQYLELEGARTLCDCNLAILAGEREFQPEAAFARTMHAEDLVFALPTFLNEDCVDPLLRRVQLDAIEGLVASLLRDGLIRRDELSCDLWDIRGALDRAKWELNRVRRERQRAVRKTEEDEMARRRAVFRKWFDGPRDTPMPFLDGTSPHQTRN